MKKLLVLFFLLILNGCVPGNLPKNLDVDSLAGLNLDKYQTLSPEDKTRVDDKVTDILKSGKDEITDFQKSPKLCAKEKCSLFNAGFRTPSLLEDLLSRGCDPSKFRDDPRCALTMLDDYGLQFNDCQNPDKDKNKVKFEQALKELDNMGLLAESATYMAAHQEMLDHEQALKAIPIEVARKSFLEAAHSEGKTKVKIVLPPDVRDVMKQSRAKYDKLLELKKSLSNLKDLDFKSPEFEKRRKIALVSVSAYNKIKPNVKKLKDRGYLIDEDHRVTLELDLINTATMLKNMNSVDSRKDDKKSSKDLALEISERNDQVKELEEIIEGEQASLQNFTWDVLEKSGNKEIGKENIFKAENQTLFDNAMEVTSWKFDPSMKFDLIKQSIETDPSVTPHDFYSKLSTNAKGNPAMSKALSFYKNYDQLMKYKSEDFSAKGFFNPMEALENKMQLKENDIGEFSAFFQLKKAMCDKPDCKLKDIYAAMSGANQGGEFLGMMLGQLGVSANDKNDRMRTLNSVKQYIAGIKNVLLGANPTCYKLLANAELGRSIDQLIAGDEAIEESCKALNDFAFNPHGARVRAVEKSCVSDGPRGHIRPAADKDKESNKKVEGRAR